MAGKTVTDRGSAQVGYRINRTPLEIVVTIQTTDGDIEHVTLTAAEVVANTTAGERSQLATIFDTKLYPAALAKAGFA